MEEKDKTGTFEEGRNNKNYCDCKDNCCQPKKKSFLPKIIFSVVILAALGIILVKLFFSASPVPASNQQVFRDPNSPARCDTTATKSCDTTKGSSCCPKSK
jgi:hypothetical protein